MNLRILNKKGFLINCLIVFLWSKTRSTQPPNVAASSVISHDVSQIYKEKMILLKNTTTTSLLFGSVQSLVKLAYEIVKIYDIWYIIKYQMIHSTSGTKVVWFKRFPSVELMTRGQHYLGSGCSQRFFPWVHQRVSSEGIRDGEINEILPGYPVSSRGR